MQESIAESEYSQAENRVRVKSKLLGSSPLKLTYDYKPNLLSHALDVANKARGFKS